MTKRYILSVTARNRPGLLAAITNALAELGGNTLEMKQSLVQQHFNLLVAIEFADHRTKQVIVDHLLSIGKPYQMELTLKEQNDSEVISLDQEEICRCFITVHGKDAPGAIRGICTLLGRELIDITDFYAVGHEESNTFLMAAELSVPVNTNQERVQNELMLHAKENDLTLEMYHVESAQDQHSHFPRNVNLLVLSQASTLGLEY